jgi:hypothetical protein
MWFNLWLGQVIRFAFGEIDKELCNRFIGSVTSELVEIEEKLYNFHIKISNLD